ncbi:MAG: hypothetical protein QMC17_06660 [Paracoccaceae bacterium]
MLLSVLDGTKSAGLRGTTLEGARLFVSKTTAVNNLRPEVAVGFDAVTKRLQRAGTIFTVVACR